MPGVVCRALDNRTARASARLQINIAPTEASRVRHFGRLPRGQLCPDMQSTKSFRHSAAPAMAPPWRVSLARVEDISNYDGSAEINRLYLRLRPRAYPFR